MKHIVMFSGGIGSWGCAKRVGELVDPKDLILIFADTKIEDEDNYRFLREAAANVGGTLIKLSDSRDPWQVFFDVKYLGNSRIAQCSHLLKQKPCRDYLTKIDPDHEAILYVGIDWSEIHRLDKIQEHWKPWTVKAPMCDAPYLDKPDVLEWVKSEGLVPPRMYDMNFSHSNCGGFCVRAGQAHFANLLRQFPERYRFHEEKEQEIRAYLDKDVSILRDRRNKQSKTLTLKQLRDRIESEYPLDELDLGGCGCFSETPPSTE